MMPIGGQLYFLAASVALSLAPGPDNLFVLALGVARGRRAAVAAAWGMCSGITVHTAAAAVGVSAVFRSSRMAFDALKYGGALYLLYMAWEAFRAGQASAGGGPSPTGTSAALFRRGLTMNLLNPKVALFFLAFLPQFASPAYGSVPLQLVLLGALFMVQATVVFTLLALFAGTAGQYLGRRPGATRWLHRAAAGVFAGLALRLALAAR